MLVLQLSQSNPKWRIPWSLLQIFISLIITQAKKFISHIIKILNFKTIKLGPKLTEFKN